MAAIVLSRLAFGHTLGLSVADFDVGPDGQVAARLSFASAEPLGDIALDRNGDGAVTQEDIDAAGDDLRSFLAQGVEVDADGTACPGTFHGASLAEFDGLLIEAAYACPVDAAKIEVTLYYLGALPRGHREIARIAAGERVESRVLTRDSRAIALPLAGRHRAGMFGRPGLVPGALGAGAVLVLGSCWWGARRWRAARAAWQNRAS
jgi:hypothetical protein